MVRVAENLQLFKLNPALQISAFAHFIVYNNSNSTSGVNDKSTDAWPLFRAPPLRGVRVVEKFEHFMLHY